MHTRRILPAAAILILAALLLNPSAADSGEVFEIKFGTLAPDGTPWSEVLYNFKERVEADSGGRIKVKVWLNGSLGDEKAMLQKMRFGQLNGGGFSTGGISTVVPELQILELPFLFDNHAEADHIMDEVIMGDLKAALSKKDLRLWIWAENGWLDFAGKHPIRSLDQLRGGKVAMQESTVQLTMYEAMGVKATPLPVPEIMGALQTGLVDSYSGSPIFSTAAQWFAYTTHWADSDHSYQPAAVVFSQRFWDTLPPDLQTMVDGYADDMTKEVRDAVRGLDPELFEGFKENGIEVYEWTPEERAAFKKAAWPSHAEMVKRGAFPQALLDKTYGALETYRASH
ncbi:MAG: C4-dicarboxylate ABC transporter substrate-binding protein [Proteobacteria bacterium]|nr:C4-dicarboxylate ABC transporter substrate-binding protein [Pseudomonadota bacterium]